MDVEATATEPLPVAEGWLPVDAIADSRAAWASRDAVIPVHRRRHRRRAP